MPLATTLAEVVRDIAVEDGDRTAIYFQTHTISFAQLNTLIEVAANALAANGIGAGDRVCLMLPNIPHFPIAYYAILRLGAVVVPINVLYKAEEIAFIAQDSEAKAMIAHEAFLAAAGDAVAQSPTTMHTFIVAQAAPPAPFIWWPVNPPLLQPQSPRRAGTRVTPQDLAVICYTSGTTGKSKGAMLTHRNLIANCDQILNVSRFDYGRDDKALLVLPLFHIYGMNVGLNSMLRLGASVVLLVRFEAITVLEEIVKHQCTIFLGAPPMYVALVNHPALKNYDLSCLRVANSGAAALPAQILRQFESVTGLEISEGYGLTETSPVTHSNSAGPVAKPGTVGPTIPGVEARIVDQNDQPVPAGEEGEIVVRGDNIMAGYWRNAPATEEALRGGWFHTGDIGTVDGDGYFTIVDRLKDMINAGGFKVWPREVEEVLYRHPAVREAAVVAMPDPYAGERPVAFVTLRDGEEASGSDLIAYCREHLASFKAPSRVEFRTDLPKLLTGKVLRRELRDEARSFGAEHV